MIQSGEDIYYSDEMLCDLICRIKSLYPDCALTLSIGEHSFDSYKAFFNAGADRYLLRHESATKSHYQQLHPAEMSFDNRIRCLNDLRRIGFAVGCGFMVGSPYQTISHLAYELKFIETFKPDMCGIGPFIPHKDTPFSNYDAGLATTTCFLLSLIRLIQPNILLPATTALNSIDSNGRQSGILAGANVIMPNLTPENISRNYTLYDNKSSTGLESSGGLDALKDQMKSIGYNIVTNRGDVKNEC